MFYFILRIMEGFEGHEFLFQADQEYLAARLLLNAGAAISTKGTYHAHTALELILKAYIAQQLDEMVSGHDLEKLAVKAGEAQNPYFTDIEIIEKLKLFNPYQQLGRYGANSNHASDPFSQNDSGIQTRGVIIIDDILRNDLDELYLTIRSLVPTKQINGLRAVKEGNQIIYSCKGGNYLHHP